MNEKGSFFLFFLLFSVIISDPVSANGPAGPEAYREPLFIFMLIFLFGPLMESLIVALFLRKNESNRTRIHLILFFFAINLMTVPSTQVLVILLSFITDLYLLAEIYPLIFESASLLCFFRFQKNLRNHYSMKYIVMMVLISNIATLIMGLILLHWID